jgi:hypothetical protein
VSLKTKPKRARLPGRSKVCAPPHRDRRPAFCGNEPELNRESPRGGGRSKGRRFDCCGPAWASRGDFFLARRNFRGVSRRIRESFQRSGLARALFYFVRLMAGGGQKSGTFQPRTGALPTQTFPRISRNVFLAPGGSSKVWPFSFGPVGQGKKKCREIGRTVLRPSSPKNSPRNSGWGGSRWLRSR